MATLRNLFLLWALLLPLKALADPSNLEQAEKHYQAGEWEKAHQLYKTELTSSGEKPPSFFFNYGTVAAKAGFAGEGYVAILHAAFLSPLDGDIRFNLRQVEARVPAAALAVRPASWFSWWPRSLQIFPWKLWAFLALTLSGGVLLLLRTSFRSLGLICSPISGLFFAAALFAWLQAGSPIVGSISPAIVKSGPGKSFSDITTLEPGALANKEEIREGWIKVRFQKMEANEDTVGWVEPGTVIDVR